MTEITRELAKILKPDPKIIPDQDPDEYKGSLAAARKAQRTLVGELAAAAGASSTDDPVLAKLEELADKRREIQDTMRLILAYARDFIRPEPYRLSALAKAANMSISGVRTAYDDEDKILVAIRIGRSDRKRTVDPALPREVPLSDASESQEGQWWHPPKRTEPVSAKEEERPSP